MNVAITVLLLLISNCFMTLAWYGHLKFKSASILLVIFISWGLAFFEYIFQVPANRLGYKTLSAFELKIIQEALTLLVFVGFAHIYLAEEFTLRYALSFALMFLAVAVAFYK